MNKFLAILWVMLIPSLAGYAQGEMTNVAEVNSSDVMLMFPMAKAPTASLNDLDVNGDGLLNGSDIVDIVLYVNGKARTAFKKERADFNDDGVVDLEDAKILSKAMTGGEIPASTAKPDTNTDSDPGTDPGTESIGNNSTVMRGDSVTDPIGP